MLRTIRRLIAASVLVALTALAFALPASAGGRPFRLTLTGAAERPNPGDLDGTGTAFVTVNPGTREVCWSVEVEGIDLPITAAHIHVGDATVAGPPVIFLLPDGVSDEDGSFSDCDTIERSLALALIVTPENYYVNVHNAPFPAGALRAQLG